MPPQNDDHRKSVLEARARQLCFTLTEGPAWEDSTTACIDKLIAASTKKAKSVNKRLGSKAVKEHEVLDNTGEVLTPFQATTYRALAARANYLAQDRADAEFAAKELCRSFARPTSSDVLALRHLVRYQVHAPRVVYRYDFCSPPSEIRVCVDTDFAGCLRTRRSTSGGMIFLNQHLVKHWSTTQPTVALSSGEAELAGIVRGAAQGLGFQALARDMGVDLKLSVYSDATAAIGIARRRGLGRVRHIHTADLWIQERIKCGDMYLGKILGSENPADLSTKFVDKMTLEKLIPMAGLDWEQGRPDLAPSLAHALLPWHNIGNKLYALLPSERSQPENSK